jgi:hypothetical protein
MQFSTALRSALAGAIKTLADTGGANGSTIQVRTGTAAGVGNTATGTLLATLTAVTFTNPSNGTLTFTATADAAGDADGTPGHVRFINQAGTAYMEYPAAVGSGEANFADTVHLGGTVSLTSGTITIGNA